MIRLILLAILALSTTEAQRGDIVQASVTLYGQGEHRVEVVAFGAAHERTVSLQDGFGAVVNVPIEVEGAPSLTPYDVQLFVDGRLEDTQAVRVCCAPWPAPLPPRLYIPLIRT